MTRTPHLPTPFPWRTTLTIRNESGTSQIAAEIARSEIEWFQSACYRGPEDVPRPLVLQLGNPAVQHFCLQNYDIPLEQVLVEYGTHKVSSINTLTPRQGEGSFIQGYAGLSCIILGLPGFAKLNGIEIQNTFITLNTPDYGQ
jgi:hypothetical protein